MNRRSFIIPRQVTTLPQHGTTVQTASPFFKFQTTQEGKSINGPISEEEYLLGEQTSRTHDMCLECLTQDIDTTTCRTVDKGWGLTWHCQHCGYFKRSKELETTFLSGVTSIQLKPAKINEYKIRHFPWVKQSSEEVTVTPLFMEIASVNQRGGMRLRETLGDADFFAYPGIFDILARGWCEGRSWQFAAFRIQGIILLCHTRNRENYKRGWEGEKEKKRDTIPAPVKQEDRAINHFHLIKSDLRTASGKSMSLCTLSEFTLTDDGKPIKCTKGQKSSNQEERDKCNLGHAIAMKLTGITRNKHTYNNTETEEWTLEQLDSVIEHDQLQRSWDFLVHTLALIQDCLPTDGEYCTITLNCDKQRSGGTRGVFTVENKGNFHPSCLRPDFRESFRI